LTIHSLPGGLLNHIPLTDDATATATAIHYLDLAGIQATSLQDFGGSDDFWAGVTKLYASNSGLKSIDGISRLKKCRYLYLDNNNLPKEELLKLTSELQTSLHHKLITLDVMDNPGLDEEVTTALLASSLFAVDDGNCYLNGKRIQR
jgi:hypothetical protein